MIEIKLENDLEKKDLIKSINFMDNVLYKLVDAQYYNNYIVVKRFNFLISLFPKVEIWPENSVLNFKGIMLPPETKVIINNNKYI